MCHTCLVPTCRVLHPSSVYLSRVTPVQCLPVTCTPVQCLPVTCYTSPVLTCRVLHLSSAYLSRVTPVQCLPVNISQLDTWSCVECSRLEVVLMKIQVHVKTSWAKVIRSWHIRNNTFTFPAHWLASHPHVPVPLLHNISTTRIIMCHLLYVLFVICHTCSFGQVYRWHYFVHEWL